MSERVHVVSQFGVCPVPPHECLGHITATLAAMFKHSHMQTHPYTLQLHLDHPQHMFTLCVCQARKEESMTRMVVEWRRLRCNEIGAARTGCLFAMPILRWLELDYPPFHPTPTLLCLHELLDPEFPDAPRKRIKHSIRNVSTYCTSGMPTIPRHLLVE